MRCMRLGVRPGCRSARGWHTGRHTIRGSSRRFRVSSLLGRQGRVFSSRGIKKVFQFYLQLCNRALKMRSNSLLVRCLARLQMFGFICNHLQPSATTIHRQQMSRCLQLHFGDEASPLLIYGGPFRGRGVPSPSVKVADKSSSATLSATA